MKALSIRIGKMISFSYVEFLIKKIEKCRNNLKLIWNAGWKFIVIKVSSLVWMCKLGILFWRDKLKQYAEIHTVTVTM